MTQHQDRASIYAQRARGRISVEIDPGGFGPGNELVVVAVRAAVDDILGEEISRAASEDERAVALSQLTSQAAA